MKHNIANAGANVKPNRKVKMYGGGMPMKKKKKKSMSYNMGGMPMKKDKEMGMARGNMGIKSR